MTADEERATRVGNRLGKTQWPVPVMIFKDDSIYQRYRVAQKLEFPDKEKANASSRLHAARARAMGMETFEVEVTEEALAFLI